MAISATVIVVARRRREILTQRLLLRRWRDDDLEPYTLICADPEVMRWIGKGTTRTREECAEAIARFEREWVERGFGLFAIELRSASRFIGFVGLSVPGFLPEILPTVEIGWRLARDAWGRGLATEGARAVLQAGLGEMGLERIVGIHQAGNRASGRIMEKLGMRFEREAHDPTCGRPVRVYEITRSQWPSASRPESTEGTGTCSELTGGGGQGSSAVGPAPRYEAPPSASDQLNPLAPRMLRT